MPARILQNPFAIDFLKVSSFEQIRTWIKISSLNVDFRNALIKIPTNVRKLFLNLETALTLHSLSRLVMWPTDYASLLRRLRCEEHQRARSDEQHPRQQSPAWEVEDIANVLANARSAREPSSAEKHLFTWRLQPLTDDMKLCHFLGHPTRNLCLYSYSNLNFITWNSSH